MAWLLAAIATVLVVECFLRTPFLRRVGDFGSINQSIFRVLRSSSISDHWKEKILPVYAGRLFRLSLTVFGLLLVCLAPAMVLGYAAGLVGIDVLGLFSSWSGLIASSAFAAVYVLVRQRVVRR